MSEPTPEKTPAEKLRDVVSQLKEMEHYSRSNIEKLSASWLYLEEDLKQKDFAAGMSDLLATQNAFQDRVGALCTEIEAECGRLEQEEA